MIITKNKLLWTVGILGIVIAIWATFKGCQKSRNQLATNAELKQQATALTAQHERDSLKIFQIREHFAFTQREQAVERMAARRKTDSISRQLDNVQSSTAKLIAERNGYRDALPGDDWVLVHPRFFTDCDSVYNVLPVLNAHIDGLQEQVIAERDLCDYEVKLRDSQIVAEQAYQGKLKQESRGFQALYQAASKVNQPRNKLYLTGTAISDMTRFGYGGGLVLTTKKGMLYGATVGRMNQRTFGQVNFGLLLSLKK